MWPTWSELLKAEGELEALGEDEVDAEMLDGLSPTRSASRAAREAYPRWSQ